MQAAARPHKSVFLSYSRADLAPVRALAMALRRHGLKTWLDLDDLQPGQRWKEAIGAALAGADAMVFCLSALSLESAWTEVEIGKALALGLPIIPVAIEPVDLGALPAALHDLHVHDMSRHPPRAAAALTAQGIASAMGVAPLHPGELHAAAEDVVDLVVVAMDEAALSDGVPPAAALLVETMDFSAPDLVRLADLLHWAGHARRALLQVGPDSDQAMVGLVLGTLCQAFGPARVQVQCRGPAGAALRAAVQAAGGALTPADG